VRPHKNPALDAAVLSKDAGGGVVKSIIGSCDQRPRIHIWPHQLGCDWSIGPVGVRRTSSSPGFALDCAIEHVGWKPMVVIVEALE
jgi:hypothetical protein